MGVLHKASLRQELKVGCCVPKMYCVYWSQIFCTRVYVEDRVAVALLQL